MFEYTYIIGGFFMSQMVTRPRKQRIKDRRTQIFKKRLLAATFAAIFTIILLTAVYWGGDNLKARATVETYTVQQNDTLYGLSKKFDSSVDEIKELNSLKEDTILIGQKLILPNDSTLPTDHIVKKGETVYSISKQYHLNIDDLVNENDIKNNHIYIGQKLKIAVTEKEKQAEMGISEFYTVVTGDTLWSISKRFDVPSSTLKKENQLVKDHVLVGQKLFIPGQKRFEAAVVVGAADSQTVEFTVQNHPVVLKVARGTTAKFQQLIGHEGMITFKNGALISFY
jgi:LysM repeat protein